MFSINSGKTTILLQKYTKCYMLIISNVIILAQNYNQAKNKMNCCDEINLQLKLTMTPYTKSGQFNVRIRMC